ncbi:hypothetical protein NEOC65_000049 [Neochlamydia sp. AcF65]|nr:hypothetical protein [Neochlamydia sp. AcF65]
MGEKTLSNYCLSMKHPLNHVKLFNNLLLYNPLNFFIAYKKVL